MSTDAEIIRRSLDAPATFAELYDRHAVTIHRYAARRIAEAADDILSETFLVAFEKRGSFEPDRDSALPWLYGISTVLLSRHRRREARAWKGLVADAAAALPGTQDEADDRIDAARSIRALAHAIHAMRPGDRDAILLYAWADLDYDGVAQALDVPVGTVRSRLNRARRQLRNTIGREDPATEVNHGRDDATTQRA